MATGHTAPLQEAQVSHAGLTPSDQEAIDGARGGSAVRRENCQTCDSSGGIERSDWVEGGVVVSGPSQRGNKRKATQAGTGSEAG